MNERNLYQRLSDIMSDVGPIKKDQVNSFQKYKFRGIDDFQNALHPLFVKHGVIGIPKSIDTISEIMKNAKGGSQIRVVETMEYTFINIDNPDERISTQIIAEGIDSSDKATNKAHSAAQKYVLMQMFLVPTEDVAEADEDNPDISDAKEFAKIKDNPKSKSNNSKSINAKVYTDLNEKIIEYTALLQSKGGKLQYDSICASMLNYVNKKFKNGRKALENIDYDECKYLNESLNKRILEEEEK